MLLRHTRIPSLLVPFVVSFRLYSLEGVEIKGKGKCGRGSEGSDNPYEARSSP